jgi:ABC-type transport system involved in multi-copper enzyme maturation permease subunit
VKSMFHLMKLELKKFKLQSYVIGAIIASMSILGFIIFISFIEKSEGVFLFINYPESFLVIDTFVRGTFIIFAATLIAELIISEFKDKTITVLFMYPISRKKLMAAKLLVIMLFTFFAIVLVNVFVSSVFYLISSNMDLVQDTLTIAVIQTIASKMFMNALAAACMSLIPLFFGMRKQSVPTTIVSSIFIVVLVCSNSNGLSLNDIIAIPISLACIGLFIAYLAIRNIEKVDVIK